ncbi:hypothetical protein HID58_026974 [Brassica napus]|uniref:Leucine-rich repeat-containing N-terminal plant-type domain-containing protein n=1 Tax=Brassica napus TaxID=3708 RepID=A0ABQ8CQG2_BRANA|nr:hypothetical protein HID58_026974 [Brassica napus]
MNKIQILDLSSLLGFSGLFDDVEGYKSLRRLRNLEILDLSGNAFNNSIFPFINAATSLTTLLLHWNNMDGLFPAKELKDLTNLELLDLSENRFNNSIPLGDLHALRNLKALDLHGICELKILEELNLSQNKLVGQFPLCLLSFNGLRVLDLSSNQLNEKLPSAIRNLESLEYMSLSNNSFKGSFSLGLLANLSKLRVFRLDSKGNSLQNEFEGNLPSSLGNMRSIEYLDLSHNSFHGKLPRALLEGCYSLVILKLSYNKLSGEIFQESVNFTGVNVLFLDNNHFTGRIGHGLRRLINLLLLDISNNNLTGVIPSWISELPTLFSLLLSNNSLEGKIPMSLVSISSIRLLDLSANSLSGAIPPHVNSGTSVVLLLQNNNLSGDIPNTLLLNIFWKHSRVYQQRKNQFSLLRGNNLTGQIPSQDSISTRDVGTYFKSLLILDQFTTDEFDVSTQTKLEFATKGRFEAYMGGNLGYMIGMDLSENELSGKIPVELGGLKEFHALNLSHNNLSGGIPESFSGLKNMESLDLSYNRLQGRIPPQLAELSSLEVFNVSYNNLVGAIPLGRQFNTFETRSYLEADDGLEEDESTIDMESFYWSLVAAYVTILIGIFASFSFDSPWSRFWFYSVDAFIYKARTWLWCSGLGDNTLCHAIARDGDVLFLKQYLIWVMILLLGQLHGYKSCILKERNALLDLKIFLISTTEEGQSEPVLPSWTNDTTSDCCQWERVKCNSTSGRVLKLSTRGLNLKESSLLNLSLLHPFEEVQILDLSESKFGGFFDGVEGYKSLSRLRNLEILDLSSNKFNSSVFHFLNAATSLTTLLLQGNNMNKLSAMVKLKFLDLSGICKLKNLQELDISQNNLVGEFPLCLTGLTGLRVIDLSSNQMKGSWTPKFQLNAIALRSCNLVKVPHFLLHQKDLRQVDLSDNNISGQFPSWLLANNTKLDVLLLRSNYLTSFQLPRSAHNLLFLDLSVNKFNHLLPENIGSLYMLDVSYNNLTGGIPSWIGENQFLGALQLSNNVLEGEIPPSLLNIFSLRLLDLSGNGLSGGLPQEVSFRTPVVLYLQDNNLSGHIPDTLLANVLILDLRNNRLSGNIPDFINTQTTNILLLRGNNLTGCIPRQLCGLSNIHLLDLANNRLNGSIPSCLSNTSLGLGKEDAPYGYSFGVAVVAPGDSTSTDSFSYLNTQYDIEFATKHRYDAYRGGILNYLYGLDLSENELTGEIPSELGDLLRLRALNLSHNYLSGVVPATFSGIRNLESLDLSFNRLHGRIPPQLTELNSLAVFNVSYNNLSGAIPQGKQFNTFETLSYLGNLLLCGQPTNTICNNVTSPESDNELVKDDDGQIDMVSFYWSSAATYVTILIGLFASLSFDSLWSRFWFYIVEVFINKVRNLLW